MLNASYLDYRIPTCWDLPSIDTVIVEVPNPGHPYGVRGVGEMSIVPPPAALANAIHAATGLRLAYLPMSPGAFWRRTRWRNDFFISKNPQNRQNERASARLFCLFFGISGNFRMTWVVQLPKSS